MSLGNADLVNEALSVPAKTVASRFFINHCAHARATPCLRKREVRNDGNEAAHAVGRTSQLSSRATGANGFSCVHELERRSGNRALLKCRCRTRCRMRLSIGPGGSVSPRAAGLKVSAPCPGLAVSPRRASFGEWRPQPRGVAGADVINGTATGCSASSSWRSTATGWRAAAGSASPSGASTLRSCRRRRDGRYPCRERR